MIEDEAEPRGVQRAETLNASQKDKAHARNGSLSELNEALKEVPKLVEDFEFGDFKQWNFLVEHVLQDWKVQDRDYALAAVLPRIDPKIRRILYRSKCHSWASAREVLFEYFHSRNTPLAAASASYLDILDIRQKPTESIDKFGERVETTAAQSIHQAVVKLPKELVIQAFVDGLRDLQLRALMRDREASFRDLRQAVEFAMANVVEDHRDSNYDASASSSSDDGSDGTTSDGDGEKVDRAASPSTHPSSTAAQIRRARRIENSLRQLLQLLETIPPDCATLEDYRRALIVAHPDLTDLEKKVALDTADSRKEYHGIQVELDPFKLFDGLFFVRTAKPFACFSIKMPKLIPVIRSLSRGKPILTPGKWLHKLRLLDLEEERKKHQLPETRAASLV